MKRFLILCMAMMVAAFSLASPSAYAQVTAYAAGQGSVNSITVGVDVRASVRGRCGFATGGAPTGSIDQADFDQTGFTKDFAIQLNCSGASRIAVSSVNGGMAAAATSGQGYSAKAPYQVALRMVADNGTSASASCDASALAGGGSARAIIRLLRRIRARLGRCLQLCRRGGRDEGPASCGRFDQGERLLPSRQRACLFRRRHPDRGPLQRHIVDHG